MELKKILAILLLSGSVVMPVVSQTRATPPASATTRAEQSTEPTTRSQQAEERLQLAISSLDYPVTPGDIYQLSYRESAGAIVTRQFQVDGISILDLGVFGKIYALNMPFYQLKQNIETMISKNYTYSTPSLSIISPSVFRVAVQNSTSQVQYITAWGLSRMSEIVAMANIPNASIRDVERISREGKSDRFDLVKTSSTSLDQSDPLVHPGDVIVLHRAERMVELRGEVRRPGQYELKSTEGLAELILVFGEGFSRKADQERLQIIRATDSGERIEYVSFKDSNEKIATLIDGDAVVVSDKTAIRALVWFEGAVMTPVQERPPAATTGNDHSDSPPQSSGNGRFYQQISEGVMLSDVLQQVRTLILASADLGSSMISGPDLREPLVIDLRPLLSRADLTHDMVVAPNMRIFIPEYQSTVSVAGAVITPGFVPYFPGAPANYYVSLCGGFNPEYNAMGALTVHDQFGRKRQRDQPIMPGDSIYVLSNSLRYNFERAIATYSPVITTFITVVTFGMAIGVINF